MTGPYSSHSLDRNEHDYDLDAKKVTVVADTTEVPAGADSDVLALNDSSQEIGTKAGSRSVGVQIVSRTSVPVYINVDAAADDTIAWIEDNEGLFLPTNLSVYVKGASGSVVFWEL